MAFFTFANFRHKAVQKSALIHPDHAPRTAQEFPKDFCDYIYVGPAIESVIYKGKRQRALVARLINEYRSRSGVTVQQEMTASIRDLQDCLHPETRKVIKALRYYYDAHVVEKQAEHPKASVSKLENMAHQTTTA